MEKHGDQGQSSQIPRQEVRLLWHCDYWDGPLSGICLYQGERYWFEAVDPFDEEEDEYVYPRRMGIYVLSAEELQEEEETHRRFQQHVGMHTDYDEQEKPSIGAAQPRSEWDKFYSWHKHRPKREYRHNELAGWFEL